MSTPQKVGCSCGASFFMFDRVQRCPYCGEVFASHRASSQEIKAVAQAEGELPKKTI